MQRWPPPEQVFLQVAKPFLLGVHVSLQLFGVVEQLKGDQARAEAENKKLRAEVESLRTRAASSETLTAEVAALREERDVIRTRVGEMLEQLDALEKRLANS